MTLNSFELQLNFNASQAFYSYPIILAVIEYNIIGKKHVGPKHANITVFRRLTLNLQAILESNLYHI